MVIKMEKMKQEVKMKLQYWRRMFVLSTCLMIFTCYNYLRPLHHASDEFADFFIGFQTGVAIVFLLFAVFQMVRYQKTLKDEEAIRNCYIKEHDERNAAIWAKSGGTVMYTCGVLIIGAAIVAGYFNQIVFITLLLCGAFLLLVKKALVIYYCKTL